MGFTLYKAEQPLQCMEVQETEEKQEKHKGKLIKKSLSKVSINSRLIGA